MLSATKLLWKQHILMKILFILLLIYSSDILWGFVNQVLSRLNTYVKDKVSLSKVLSLRKCLSFGDISFAYQT